MVGANRSNIEKLAGPGHYLQAELLERVRTDPALFDFIERGCLDGLWYWDLQQPEQEWLSPRFKAFFGFADEEMANSPLWWRANVDPDDYARAEAQIARCFADPDEKFDLIMRYRHRSGESVWVRCRGLVIRDELGQPVRMLGAHTDVTALKRKEEALARTNAELEDARARAEAENAAKSVFLARMSHEIRTPMNGVLGVAELLARTRLDDEQARLVDIIRESGGLLMATINDILDLSKIEAGAIALERAPFSLEEIGERVARLHQARAAELGAELRVACFGHLPCRLGDRWRIMQILNNLVGNALKFCEGSRVDVALRCAAPERVTLEVSDGGAGMTPEAAARIFEDYAQASPSITRRHGGTGLGLSIVKGLAEAMSGSITVTTAPNRGAQFCVTLPLPVADNATMCAPEEPAPAASVKGRRVLACDDNEINRMVLDGFMKALGAQARIVESGVELLSVVAETEWDVYLIDLVMPGMNGVETLNALRAAECALGRAPSPAIACTAYATPDAARRCLADGFDMHLAKPIAIGTLQARLAEAVAAAPAKARPAT